MRVVLIPTHIGRGLRPEIIVRHFPPKVRTYLKSTTGNFLVPARTNIAVKLLSFLYYSYVEMGYVPTKKYDDLFIFPSKQR
jgi:hypothetical protein